MVLEVKLFGNFRTYNKEHDFTLELKDKAIVKDLIDYLKIPDFERKYMIILANDKRVYEADTLKDKDIISIFPPVGGG